MITETKWRNMYKRLTKCSAFCCRTANPTQPYPIAVEANQQLANTVANIDGTESDLLIHCNTTFFRLHQSQLSIVIVIARSDLLIFFEKM